MNAPLRECRPLWWPDSKVPTEEELDRCLAEDTGLQSLIRPELVVEGDYADEIALTKRVVERWRADRRFREALALDPVAALEVAGLPPRVEAWRGIWEATETNSPQLARFRFWLQEKLWRRAETQQRLCQPDDPRHRAWRSRQMARLQTELGPRVHAGIVHAPFAIELSEGCSVGCWFCGVSAKKKGGDYRYNGEQIAEWQTILQMLRQKIGPGGAGGFLYWASDPLDNPDYELFARDFAAAFGRFPQTTTAIAHRDLERTRRLLRLSVAHGCPVNRFSILSLGQFNRIMQAFTPLELLHCELVAQNMESNQQQSAAGRARGAARRQDQHGMLEEDEPASGTIACVSGFLINMVNRSVRLITPCGASDRWPDGYQVHAEGRFEDAAGLEVLLGRMIDEQMPLSWSGKRILRLRGDARLEESVDGVSFISRYQRTRFEAGGRYGRALGRLGSALVAGRETASAVAMTLEREEGVLAEWVFHQVNRWFDAGWLDEEPTA